jgi:general secretion pathway protein K
MNFSRSKRYSKSRRPRRPDEGIALVSVVWLLLLLSGLAATVAYVARVNALITHRAVDYARAQAAADAGIIDTVSLLSDEQTTRHPAFGEAVRTWQFDGIPVTISVNNEAGRIDVNTGADDLLLAFFQSQDISAETSAALLQDLRSFQGREQESGNRDGRLDLNDAARGRPLQSVEELRQIPSWRAQNLECWMNSLTVYTQQAAVNNAAATPLASAALHWMQAHKNGHGGGTAQESMTRLNEPTSLLGEVVRIRVTARVSNDVSATNEWVGRLTGDIQKPILTMRWDEGLSSPTEHCISERRGSP